MQQKLRKKQINLKKWRTFSNKSRLYLCNRKKAVQCFYKQRGTAGESIVPEKTGREEAMKKNKSKLAKGLLSIALVLFLTGCGSASKSDSVNHSYVQEEATEYYEAEMDGGVMGESGALDEVTAESINESAATTQRKLIKTVNMDVETKEFDALMGAVQAQVKNLGGYIENMDTYNGSVYYGYGPGVRNASMTIRIPKEKLDGFLHAVSDMGNVIRRSESEEDVTLTYVDLKSHKIALETEYARLLELLEQAETIEDLITIENRLSDLRYQMESMESQLRTYDNKVDYSTVYLNIDEVEVLTPVEEETPWERISTGFVESLKNIGEGLVEFGIWFIINLPYLVMWAVIITVIVLVIKLITKRNQKKKAQRAQQQMQLQQAQFAKMQAQMEADNERKSGI